MRNKGGKGIRMLGSDPLVASTKVKASKSLFNMGEYLMQYAEIGNVDNCSVAM